MKNTISVIVAVYNVVPYLRKCVDSFLAQTYTNLKIILIDDGSTDGSGAICDEYAQKDNRIKVIHKANGGVSSARNAGLDMAKGKYIAFVDADDVILQDYFEILMADAKKYHADIVCCDCLPLDDYDGEPTGEFCCVKSDRLICEREIYFKDYNRKDGHGGDEIYGTVVWAKVIRKSLAQSVRFEGISYHEDKLYMMRLFAQSPVTYLDTYRGYHYMRWSTSATMRANTKRGGYSIKRAIDAIYVMQQKLNIVKHFSDKEIIAECEKRYAAVVCSCLSTIVMADDHDTYVAVRSRIVQDIAECFGYKHIGFRCRLELELYKLNGGLYWNIRKIARKIKLTAAEIKRRGNKPL